MHNNHFTYTFNSSQPVELIFSVLQDVRQWWMGIYNETITGSSLELNDEFRFVAGGGVHDTTQQLIEIDPGKKIAWQVINSNLSFLHRPDEWTGTRFNFELTSSGNMTQVTFTHEGLLPEIECYHSCSNGWMQYLRQLEKKLQ